MQALMMVKHSILLDMFPFLIGKVLTDSRTVGSVAFKNQFPFLIGKVLTLTLKSYRHSMLRESFHSL